MHAEKSNQEPSDSQETNSEEKKGDWSEHISSSGKKYYYNCRSEVSQWEKPKEWIEWERKHASTANDKPKDSSEASSSSKPGGDRHHRSSNQPHDEHSNSSRESQTSGHPNPASHTKPERVEEEEQFQDMDISPDATPTSSPTRPAMPDIQQRPVVVAAETQQPVSLSLAQLPRLLSQLTRRDKSEFNPREALQTLQTALLLSTQATRAQTTVLEAAPVSVTSRLEEVNGSQAHPNSLNCQPIPVVDYNHNSPGRDSPTSSITSLHSIGTSSLAVQQSAPLSLTPSLANYYKQQLISHVTGWQAEHAEKQAIRYGQDTYTIADLNCTKVSADLKMSRSLVRVADIRATVQEQRVLFLRQQIKELEDLKSQNSYMSSST